jgi:hypothetical protein
MTRPVWATSPGSDFDDFLFAPIGEETKQYQHSPAYGTLRHFAALFSRVNTLDIFFVNPSAAIPPTQNRSPQQAACD